MKKKNRKNTKLIIYYSSKFCNKHIIKIPTKLPTNKPIKNPTISIPS